MRQSRMRKVDQLIHRVPLAGRTTIDLVSSGEVLNWRRTIQEQGYGLLDDVFTRDEVLYLLNEVSTEALPRTRAGIRHAMRSKSVARIARDPRLLRIARLVLGNDAIAFRATMFEKLPASNWLVAWHQDTALPIRHRRDVAGWGPWSLKDGVNYAHAPAQALEKIFALRLHLDDSTSENGPLRVLPGTHLQGVLTDAEIHAIAEGQTSVDCLMPFGGIVAIRPLIIHASSKSRIDKPRRVLHIEYAESAEIAEGLQLALA
jgi:ectoine hydroxylase-related dioxygenase (phytanoyl-CoA dioxygenase family)